MYIRYTGSAINIYSEYILPGTQQQHHLSIAAHPRLLIVVKSAMICCCCCSRQCGMVPWYLVPGTWSLVPEYLCRIAIVAYIYDKPVFDASYM